MEGEPTEIRVHGVSGTPADALLATDPVPVEGARPEGIVLYRPVEVDPWARAYHWSSLTSGRPATAVWIVLLPYLLLNVAGWARPPMPARATAAWTALTRVAGLALTAIFTLVTANGVIGVGGLGVLTGLDPGWSVALGGGVTVLIVTGLWLLTSRVGTPPREEADTDPAPGATLADDATWRLRLDRPLRRLHGAVALTAVTAAVRTAVAGTGEAALASPLGVVLLVGVPLAAVAAIVVRPTARRPADVVVLAASAGFAWSVVEAAGGVACRADCPLGGPLQVTVAAYSMAAVALLVLGALAATDRSNLSTAPALLTLAGSTGTSVGAAAVAAAAAPFGVTAAGFGALAASFLAGTTVVAAAAVAAMLGPPPEPPPPPPDDARPPCRPDAGSGVLAGIRRLRDRASVVSWVVVAVTAALAAPYLLGGSADLGLLTVVAGAAAVVAAVLAAGWLWRLGRRRQAAAVPLPVLAVGAAVAAGWVDFSQVAVAVTLFLPLGWVAARIAGGLRSRDERRALAVLWDVGSVFPRWFHPFAPPSYGHVVVPDLASLVDGHAGEGPVLLAGHSQGSVLAAAAVHRLTHPSRVALLTFGSPLGSLYRRHFPAVVGDDFLRGVSHRLEGRWVNLHRDTDPIGGAVPASRDVPLRDPCGRGHGWYWLEPDYEDAGEDLLAEVGAGSIPPRYRRSS